MSDSLYTYCFADIEAEIEDKQSFGSGVDDEPVSVLLEQGIGAVVHKCAAEAYDTDEREQAETWIKQHNETIERVAAELGPALPMTFDTIFESEDAVRRFLADHIEQISERLETLAQMDEYGVRIYCEEELLIEEADQSSVTEDAGGAAFFEEMKRDKQRQREIAENVKARFQSYFQRIDSVVDKITEEDLDDDLDEERGRNVLTVSCLVSDHEIQGLKQVLDEINDEDGVEIVFTGPWLPYSFVGSLGPTAANTKVTENGA
ncbi:gas vesicle protein GvpL [Halalkalicoccus subterraneus]|uniref:gas vesicle protein GvpL n=1 Tax=Halalkalicoccus subterraneus TaxID=2675002 RepID=UPI000EFD5103|nr:GvpL/GvpF family gas vesicle protein [Halalkalicoccus subterraneus]